MAIILTKPTTHLVLRLLIVVGVLSWVTPAVVHGALININTADLATLDELPGVGSVTAQYIIDGRPYASIEDISQVKGIGGPGTKSYEDIKDLITVGDVETNATSTQTDIPVSQSAAPKIETITQYAFQTVTIEPPPDIFVRTPKEIRAVVGASIPFEAEIYDAKGKVVSSAHIIWTFGDGAQAYGRKIVHAYRRAGTYIVVVRAEGEYLSSEARIRVTVVPVSLAVSIGEDGAWVAVRNDSAADADLSFWRLSPGWQYFVFPERTVIPAGETVKFDSKITGLSTLKASGTVMLFAPGESTPLAEGGIVAVKAEEEEAEEEGASAVQEEEAGTPEESEGSITASQIMAGDAKREEVSTPGSAVIGRPVASSMFGFEGEADGTGNEEEKTSAEELALIRQKTEKSQTAAAAVAVEGKSSIAAKWWVALASVLAFSAAAAVFARRQARATWRIEEAE